MNTQHAQLSPNSLPRRVQHPQPVTTVRGVWQDNPTPPRDRTASPQPASPKNKIRPHPFDVEREFTHPGRPKLRQTKPTTIHLKLRVSAALARKAEEQGLSVSATGAALIEWALQQSIYEQTAATLDTAIDKSIGRHMRTYSDRNAGLQARNLQKTELVFHIVTNILGRMPGMNEEIMRNILRDADELASASIARMTEKQKNIVDAEKQQFEKKGVRTRD